MSTTTLPFAFPALPPWDRGRTTCRAAELSAWFMYFIYTPIAYYSIRSNRRSGDVLSPNITLGLFKEADGLAPRIDAYVGRVLQLPAHQDATARLHAEEDGPDASAAQPERGPVTAPGRARGVGGHRAGTEPRGPKGPPPCSGRAAPTMLGVRPPRSGSVAAARYWNDAFRRRAPASSARSRRRLARRLDAPPAALWPRFLPHCGVAAARGSGTRGRIQISPF